MDDLDNGVDSPISHSVNSEKSLVDQSEQIVSDIEKDSKGSEDSDDILKDYSHLQIKPHHWHDTYWEAISTKFKWFIHKDNYIGCAYCHKYSENKRKTLMSGMKQYLMDLSFDDLENKLLQHRTTPQHNKALAIVRFKSRRVGRPKKEVVHKPTVMGLEHICPLCSKVFKTRKAISKHIYNCKTEETGMMKLTCCDKEVSTLCELDSHNLLEHNNMFRIKCHSCLLEFEKSIDLFSHITMSHNFIWNPHTIPPSMVKAENADDGESGEVKRPVRKRTLASSYTESTWLINDDFSKVIEDKQKEDERRKSRKVEEVYEEKRLEKFQMDSSSTEVSKLCIPQCFILTCKYCGGRYLSETILNDHIAHYHSDSAKKVQKQKDILKQNLYKELTETFEGVKEEQSSDGATKNDFKRNASILTCSLCQTKCESISEKVKHIEKEHNEYYDVTCHECGLIFNHTNFASHMKSQHKIVLSSKPTATSTTNTSFSCNLCPLVFTNKWDLQSHIKLSHVDLSVALDTDTSVVQDDKNTSALDAEQCTKNGNVAETEDTDKYEVIELTGLRSAEDEGIQEIISVETTKLEDSVECVECNKKMDNQFELAVHNYVHKDQSKAFLCVMCNQLFFGNYHSSRFADHKNFYHKKMKPIPCEKCGQSFSSTYLLESHTINGGVCVLPDQLVDPYSVLTKQDRMAFQCSICSFIFAGPDAESRMDSHAEECNLN